MKGTFRCTLVLFAAWFLGSCGGGSSEAPPPCPTNTFFGKFVVT